MQNTQKHTQKSNPMILPTAFLKEGQVLPCLRFLTRCTCFAVFPWYLELFHGSHSSTQILKLHITLQVTLILARPILLLAMGPDLGIGHYALFLRHLQKFDGRCKNLFCIPHFATPHPH